jgi:hypothetical protein
MPREPPFPRRFLGADPECGRSGAAFYPNF